MQWRIQDYQLFIWSCFGHICIKMCLKKKSLANWEKNENIKAFKIIGPRSLEGVGLETPRGSAGVMF